MADRITKNKAQRLTPKGINPNNFTRLQDVKNLISEGQETKSTSSDEVLSSLNSIYIVDTSASQVTLTFNPDGISDLKEWFIKREGDNLLTIVPISGSNIDGDTDGIQITEDDATIHLIKIGNNLKILN